MDEIPPEVPGYRLTRLIGRGSTASVWRARRADDDELVAVKLVPGRADEEAVREYSLLQHAASEHVVTLHETIALEDLDGGDRPGATPATALVLDLLPGGSLAGVVSARGHLTPGETVTVIAPIAQALAGLHELGIVHGDASPGNVLLDSTGRPCLSDLGYARLAGEQHGQVHGTEGFIAPEVLEGATPTRASDVHALGALAWLCLVGEPPGHVAERPALAELVDSPQLAEVVESCLATEPEERPEADDVAVAVFDAVDAEPLRMTSPGDVASGLTRRIRETSGQVPVPSWQRELAAQATAREVSPARWWRRWRGRGRTSVEGTSPDVSRPQGRRRSRRRSARHAEGRRRGQRRTQRAGTGDRWTGRAGGIRTRGWIAIAGLAGLVIALLVPWPQLALAGGEEDHPSSSPTATASAGQAGADLLRDRSAIRRHPRQVVTALTELREDAVVDADQQALARLVVPGSPAARQDARLLRQLRSSGERFHGVDLEVQRARVRWHSRGSASVRTTIDEETYELRRPDGTREVRDARPGRVVDLVLVWHDGSWRVRQVRGAPEVASGSAAKG